MLLQLFQLFPFAPLHQAHPLLPWSIPTPLSMSVGPSYMFFDQSLHLLSASPPSPPHLLFLNEGADKNSTMLLRFLCNPKWPKNLMTDWQAHFPKTYSSWKWKNRASCKDLESLISWSALCWTGHRALWRSLESIAACSAPW